jgi:hypothetical protein
MKKQNYQGGEAEIADVLVTFSIISRRVTNRVTSTFPFSCLNQAWRSPYAFAKLQNTDHALVTP